MRILEVQSNAIKARKGRPFFSGSYFSYLLKNGRVQPSGMRLSRESSSANFTKEDRNFGLHFISFGGFDFSAAFRKIKSKKRDVAVIYRRDIDGLRAVAVMSVVIFHAFPGFIRGGFIGVDIFFVISGFLISSIIFEGLNRGAFSFRDFYARRVRRIFPSLLIVLISCLTFAWFALLADELNQLGRHVAAGAGFVSNFVLWSEVGYFDNSAETKPLLHLWSLSIEEQYYLVWPLVSWLI